MSVVVVGRIPDQNTYEEVGTRVMSGDQLPEGCQVHIAGPSDEGFRVITVWDSEDDYRRFREEKLVPAIQEVTGGAVEGPQAEVQPVHRHISA
jgi:hypothetical protein